MPNINKIANNLLERLIKSEYPLKLKLFCVKKSVAADLSPKNFNINQEKKGKIPGKPRVLVAPLDWGLGHASRCIPLIQELSAQGCEVWLAAEGPTATILKTEFPGLVLVELSGYHINYSVSAKGFIWRIISQIPKIRASISYENKWLKKQLTLHDFDAIISDNRFGLHTRHRPCIFITHQLTIKSPFGRWSERILQRWNYGHINRFTGCWVPDFPGENNISGQLSHPAKKPSIPLKYIGCLSRFIKNDTAEKKGHIIIILSGPEPQRRILENKLIDELIRYNGTADVIRGLPSSDTILPSTNHLRFYNHLPADELNKKMTEAEFVISRTGYSTVMDIIQLQKKSILIPTPGQTEQEYLARYLQQRKIAYCLQQDDFLLNPSIERAKNFPYHFIKTDNSLLKKAVQTFISEIKTDQFTR